MTTRRFPSAPRSALALTLIAGSPLATAGVAFESGDFKGEYSLSASATAINSHNANFGLGRIDLRSGELSNKENYDWQEYYLKPGVTSSTQSARTSPFSAAAR